jgi:hypothetical protein
MKNVANNHSISKVGELLRPTGIDDMEDHRIGPAY